ncbi:MAG: hypothetical protein EBY29_12775, partial [Planctomycetes bacterium]|nr:hypothetical protein [Planctomycetota bacterium]
MASLEAELRDMRDAFSKAVADATRLGSEVDNVNARLNGQSESLRLSQELNIDQTKELSVVETELRLALESLMKSQIEVKQLTEELLSFRVLASSQTTHSDNVEAENAKLSKELHDSNHSNEMLSKEIARLWDELNTSEQSRHATDASLLAAHKRIGELELELQSRSDDLLKEQLELSRVSSECSELSSRLQMRAVELKASEDGNVRITRELSDSLDKISTLSSDVVALQGDVHKAELVRVSLSGELSLAAEKITGLTMDARSLQEVLSRSEDELEALTKQSKDTEGRLREESQRCRDAEEAISSLKSANVEKQHEV